MVKIITFNTTKGPKAIGPYSTAKIYNNTMYLSGNIGVVPETGELISDDVEEQARRVMENIKIILGETKCEFDYILKCTVYLTSMADFGKVNAIYGEYFDTNPPARVAVAVAELPKGSKVEIDATIAFPHSHL